MPRLPVISGRGLIKILTKAGLEVVRQKGSDVSLRKDQFQTVVQLHRELARGTVLGILKPCGWSLDDLRRELGR